jgi:hypothetical protein
VTDEEMFDLIDREVSGDIGDIGGE